MKNNPVTDKVSAFLIKTNIDFPGKSVAVCFSGGADSTALLCAFYDLNKKFGYRLCAFHVNHCIRGEESDRDERFCRSICKKFGIDIIVRRVDIPSIALESKKGIEETARDVRYGLMHEHSNKIDYFATAHNENDNAETILFNIIRGASVNGLSGIPQIRGNILRPLLAASRDEITAYLKEKNIGYVTDSTNSDTKYTRNYIRHIILPSMKKINPGINDALIRIAESAKADNDFFDANANTTSLHPAVLNRKISRQYIEYTNGEALSSVHIEAIAQAIRMNKRCTLDLPLGICAFINCGELTFGKRIITLAPESVILKIGSNTFANGRTTIILSNQFSLAETNVNKKSIQVCLNFGKIKGTLYARSRKNGDRILSIGITRNVKKTFINKKISLLQREAIPVICDDDGIVYVPYIGAADRVYEKEKSDNTLYITVEFNGERNQEIR